jgi:choline dehydrogenase-like flavoprotein
MSGIRAERLLVERGRAVGLLAASPGAAPIAIRARKVIVACGATETPGLLRRSGLGTHPRLGRGLSIHPALGAAGWFAEPVIAWHGVLQSVGIEEFHERRGILIEATSTPPGMGAMTTPGFGPALVQRINNATHVATVGAMIADRPSGRVVGGRRPRAVYNLARADARRLIEALGAIARVLFAAGAERVELGGGAPILTSPGDIDSALQRVRVGALRLAAFHPTGTAAAGSDPSRHPVASTGALRGVGDVWVADASIVPSCPGVNPQLSIMGLSAGVGQHAASA